MKIAIDLDNTLFNLRVVEDSSRVLGLNYTTSDVKSWGYREFSESLRKEIYRRFSDHIYMCCLKPFPNVKNKIVEWYNCGHDMDIITCRNEHIARDTVNMVHKELPEIRNIYFAKDHKNKAEIVFNDEYDIYIDDDGRPMDELTKVYYCGQMFLISNNDTMYNEGYRNNFFITCVKGISSICLPQ